MIKKQSTYLNRTETKQRSLAAIFDRFFLIFELSKKKLISKMQKVIPGSRLGPSHSLVSSTGTWIKGDHIYSSVYGTVLMENGVVSVCKTLSELCIDIGCIVIGTIVRINTVI